MGVDLLTATRGGGVKVTAFDLIDNLTGVLLGLVRGIGVVDVGL